ncbi:fimbrial biogenesis chaperone [Klebsiella aerogenes]|uniref:fimbrial biogenesis chaperone n=1 Tax=Klebsiella aerogenes TaxID=548 RepID=UPI001903CA89|nr:molecular chaperone [Klebsiella aerogenes]MBK0469518.1 molecular chaperone [Klebsiella aerogenes]HBU8526149.1 molecular chaperone [Klebsiella aerogenes]
MRKLFTSTGFLLALFTSTVFADGFGINVTRVIFKGNSNNTTVVLRNTSPKDTYIVQSRISKTVDGYEQTPFTITPPIFRLEPASTNNLRIRLNSSNLLSQDRETIFYLNTRAIPASIQKDKTDGVNRISGTAQFGVGTIIKLFYRPKNTPGTSDDAQKNVSFSTTPKGIKVKNNSAYYINFSSLTINGIPLIKNNAPSMIAPYDEFIYVSSIKKGKVSWSTINDYGGINAYTTDM